LEDLGSLNVFMEEGARVARDSGLSVRAAVQADRIQKHPDLRELLDERRALMQRYLSVRKQKFKGRLIVWD
jgi:hypothetical protein